jgi:hypothetical protein
MGRDVLVLFEHAVDKLRSAYVDLSWLNMEEPYDSELAQIRLDIVMAQQEVFAMSKKLTQECEK